MHHALCINNHVQGMSTLFNVRPAMVRASVGGVIMIIIIMIIIMLNIIYINIISSSIISSSNIIIIIIIIISSSSMCLFCTVVVMISIISSSIAAPQWGGREGKAATTGVCVCAYILGKCRNDRKYDYPAGYLI